jgi:hypothetical protein
MSLESLNDMESFNQIHATNIATSNPEVRAMLGNVQIVGDEFNQYNNPFNNNNYSVPNLALDATLTEQAAQPSQFARSGEGLGLAIVGLVLSGLENMFNGQDQNQYPFAPVDQGSPFNPFAPGDQGSPFNPFTPGQFNPFAQGDQSSQFNPLAPGDQSSPLNPFATAAAGSVPGGGGGGDECGSDDSGSDSDDSDNSDD